ncbi:antirestriction protein [Yersinia enterocolitica]|nr:antirestriction protein [Yersinia enterocolitica]
MTTQTDTAYEPVSDSQMTNVITVSPVSDEQRLDFWPQYFGRIPQWILIESRIFAWMERFCEDYSGGIWHFHTLSNGGAFMAPETENDEKWTLFNNMNGNGAEMSAEAAGIAVCLIEYSHHACRTECDAMTEQYYRLRDYALQHPESHAILAIID